MPNIKFNYLYRDSANYKKYGFVIFAHSDETELAEVETLVRSKLIYTEWFYAEEWHLPELFLDSFDFKLDPAWHEFESIEYTEDSPTQPISITQFKQLIEKTNWQQ
jgi:hypothetical protein